MDLQVNFISLYGDSYKLTQALEMKAVFTMSFIQCHLEGSRALPTRPSLLTRAPFPPERTTHKSLSFHEELASISRLTYFP